MADPPRRAEQLVPAAFAEAQGITAARIGLGRSGTSVCTRDQLAFQLDHALARDAVVTGMKIPLLLQGLHGRGWSTLALRSAATQSAGAKRQTYLLRPDLGRALSLQSAADLREAADALPETPDVVFILADGLSAVAIERNALALLDALQKALAEHGWRTGPVCVVQDGRVAIGDEIGEALRATLAVVLIGERPGLSAHDSLGVYLTWEPRTGRTDAERLCISNIREGGLSCDVAAAQLIAAMDRARGLGRTGVALGADLPLLLAGPAVPGSRV